MKSTSSSVLTPQQIAFFKRSGYLVVADAVDPGLLQRLKDQFELWVEESRQHGSAYGTTINDKPRFDLEPGHTATSPKLRRVNAPVEVSDACMEAMRDSRVPGMVADLIGPNVKFHHSKINSKLPGGETAVKWHQDFPFTPHTNDDLVTALLMVDPVTDRNGPLRVLPGSHTGPLYTLWHEGVFTGSVEDAVAQQCEGNAESCMGEAGSVCLMHTRLLHGSSANLSSSPRTLLINVYSADDAIPCSPSPMPNRYEGMLVRGVRSGRMRCSANDLALPALPESASFFDQQKLHGVTTS